ncbi:MAG: NAD-dependent epimerase/dehydratase family protein [bacterium]
MKKETCLVTGGAGFIGSHVVDTLIEAGCSVAVLDSLSSGCRDNLHPDARFYEADILDRIDDVFDREQPKVVFHLAAQVSVSRSTREPAFDARTNVEGSVNVLQQCVRTGVRRIVYASSAAVYGEPPALPLREDQMVFPLSPYGISKYVVEYYLYYQRHAHGLDYVALRYGNVYGPRQDPHGEAGVVAIFSQQLLDGKEAVIYGDGLQTRDFVYVRDVARANLLAKDAAIPGDMRAVFNIGTGCQTTVNEVFDAVRKHSGSGQKEIHAPPRPGDVVHSYLANDLAKTHLAWEPMTTVSEGLRETVDYFKSLM